VSHDNEDLAGEIISKGPCGDCGSDDNLVTYGDGHRWCYSPGCGKKTSVELDGITPKAKEPRKVTEPSSAVPFTTQHMAEGLKKRGLKLETLKRYGYFNHKDGGKVLQIAPYYNQAGQLVYQKYRNPEKDFWFTELTADAPKVKDLQLFGRHVFGEKHDRKVVVTEGEIDAMSVYQAMGGKVPVVSIISGADSALNSLKANYRWLDRFEEIILWFDNDEPGQKPIAECANLFTPGKVKTVKVEGFKDASDMLQAGKDGDVYSAVWGASVWAPAGIVNAADCGDDMLAPAAVVIGQYPFPKLQEVTLGILEQEVVYHVAGTGVGKTSMIVELQHGLLQQGIKFGVMRFEDTRKKTQLDLVSRHVGERLHITQLTKPDPQRLRALHTEVFGGGLVELFDPETADWSFDSILGYIRYMAKALDCKVIFIDPLSFIVAAVNSTDERKALDHVAYKFAQMVKQSNINLQITHHLNRGDGKAFEEGGEISLKNIRGSAGIANFSMGVFGYERNQQGDRPDLTRIRVLKNRFAGWTGLADTLKWNEERGSQDPTDEPYPDNKDSSEFGAVSPNTIQEY